MGPAKSKQEAVSTEFVNHPKFNQVVVVERNGEKYIQTQVPVHAEREFRDWERSQKDLEECNKENLLLPEHFEFQKEGLCGSTGIVKILYENYPYLLTDEIYNRKGLDKLFDESEIWYLLYTAVSAAKDFQKTKQKLGDVRPQNIFINEDGQVKLANIYSWPNEEDNYMKTVLNNEATYLAPEEVAELQNGKHQYTCDPNLAESFSIGLTIIDAGLLGDATALYNFKNQKFDDFKARELFNQWASSAYSDFLKRTVLSLCEIDPKNRSSPADVYSKLQPYEDDIKNLKDFANSVQGSPNRPTGGAIQTGYPTQFRPSPYQYEGPPLVKSQLVPEKYSEGISSDAGHTSLPAGTYVPGQVTTTYTTYAPQPTYTTGQPTSFTGPSGATYTTGSFTKQFTTGNISSGISALNPPAYYTSAASAPVPYQYQYQPVTVVTSGLPTTTGARPYEVSNPVQGTSYGTALPPLTSYTGATYTTSQPIGTFSAGSNIPAGSTGSYSAYTQSYYPTTATASDQVYVAKPYFTTSEVQAGTTGIPPASGSVQQSSSKSKLGTISTSGVGPADTIKHETNVVTTTVTRIVNGQPVSTDVDRVFEGSSDAVKKDLNDARQVTSIVPPPSQPY